jgi:hypothetical protein
MPSALRCLFEPACYRACKLALVVKADLSPLARTLPRPGLSGS